MREIVLKRFWFAARCQLASSLFYDSDPFPGVIPLAGFTRFTNFVGDDHRNICFCQSRMMLHRFGAVISGPVRHGSSNSVIFVPSSTHRAQQHAAADHQKDAWATIAKVGDADVPAVSGIGQPDLLLNPSTSLGSGASTGGLYAPTCAASCGR